MADQRVSESSSTFDFDIVSEYIDRRFKSLEVSEESQVPAGRSKISHQCAHCELNTVDEQTLHSGTLSLSLRHDIYNAVKAAMQGCELYIWLVDHLVMSRRPIRQFEPIRFILIFASDHGSVGRGDVIGVRVCIDRNVRPGQWERQELGDLFICTPADNVAAASVRTRPVNSDVSTEHSFDFARKCLEKCPAEHYDCRRNPNTPLGIPQRLLDINIAESDNIIRVFSPYDPSNNSNQPPIPLSQIRYAILSYCWGGDQNYKLTREREASYKAGLEVSKLHKTVQDAIHVTRRLNLQYLWVDSLCILQDSADDKAAEINLMPSYFENSSVTICAASSTSSKNGFLERRPVVQYSIGPFELPYRRLDGQLGSVQLFREADLSPEPVIERAWTLQETSLSPRALIYGSKQLHWTCLTTRARDGGLSCGNFRDSISRWLGRDQTPTVSGTHPLSLRYDYTTSEILQQWYRTVEDYMDRKMSLQEDKLPAMSGLAAIFKKRFLDARRHALYCAGLWSFQLETQLLWVTVSAACRPENYRAPTWTWAAVDGKVSHRLCHTDETLRYHHTISDLNFGVQGSLAQHSTIEALPRINANVILARPNIAFGEVTGGSLLIFGRLKKMAPEVKIVDYEDFGRYEEVRAIEEHPVVRPDTDDERIFLTMARSEKATAWLLELIPFSTFANLKGRLPETPKGLVLARNGNESYRRIGGFHFDCSPGNEEAKRSSIRQSYFEGIEKKLIVVV